MKGIALVLLAFFMVGCHSPQMFPPQSPGTSAGTMVGEWQSDRDVLILRSDYTGRLDQTVADHGVVDERGNYRPGSLDSTNVTWNSAGILHAPHPYEDKDDALGICVLSADGTTLARTALKITLTYHRIRY